MVKVTRKLRLIATPALISFTLCCAQAAMGWDAKPRDDQDSMLELPVAFETNKRGDLSEVYLNSDDKVSLRVTLAPGFIQFAADNCPTIQVDDRTPVHHQVAGENCVVYPQVVSLNIGDVVDDSVVSLPLHRIMNGGQLAVRFVTASGEYRQALFSLRNSKQAIQAALGAGVEVKPNLDDS